MKMSLSLSIEVDEVTVSSNGIVLVRESRKVFQDTMVISEAYHRYSLLPGDNIDDQPERVRNICNAVWTSEVIANFQASNQIQDSS